MAPIRYSLHYEDYSEHLMSRFGKLLQMQSLVDMTLMCSSHTLRVHKVVLAASSAYFQEVLENQTGDPLIMLKMRFSVLKCLVEFMYCGKTQCLEENLDELVSAAHFLKIKGLSKVTKEGLGITSTNELPIFTPPVVINRPPQSLLDGNTQDVTDVTQPLMSNSSNPNMELGRPNKDMVVRIPFDIENGGASGGGAAGAEYDTPRVIKPRRGRPSARRNGAWGGGGALGRALLRREQDSRNAIHHLKHLQTRHLQDYMDRVTLSQAVKSICGPESTSSNYMNLDNDLMYMEQTGGVLEPGPYGKDPTLAADPPAPFNSGNDPSSINTAMSQYVNALKSAGLPTDLPILFESGDGSYINVNEQVLLDMVQSSEIQYEVIEQPNIIEKVADPSEIKSIDDLSKSIERGEMMLGSKGYPTDFEKDQTQYSRHEDAINSLNAILPDNLESFGEQQNYVVLDPPLQENNNTIDNVHAHDFSCMDNDMQYFTKAMSDDVKKYYVEQHLNDARTMDQLCPTSSNLDTNFSISLLDSKCDLSNNIGQHFNSVKNDDLRRNDDCYDFDLQLPQSTVFKDPLDCLMDTPKRTGDEDSEFNERLDEITQEREEIIKDLLNIEDNMHKARTKKSIAEDSNENNLALDENIKLGDPFSSEANNDIVENDKSEKLTSIPKIEKPWVDLEINKNSDRAGNTYTIDQMEREIKEESLISKEPFTLESDKWEGLIPENNETEKDVVSSLNSSLEDDIPFAVGLLPKKQVQISETTSLLKRKNQIDENLLDIDAKCLKRKVKYRK